MVIREDRKESVIPNIVLNRLLGEQTAGGAANWTRFLSLCCFDSLARAQGFIFFVFFSYVTLSLLATNLKMNGKFSIKSQIGKKIEKELH